MFNVLGENLAIPNPILLRSETDLPINPSLDNNPSFSSVATPISPASAKFIYIMLVKTYMHILLALRLLYLLLKDKMATGLLKSIGPNIIIESI